ncbi:MAG: ATP-binding cassette domain-containing protein, partial [Gemmatimonadota bacterium]
NGAGKSSLVRVLRGMLPITRGRIRYGRDAGGRAVAADPTGQIVSVSFTAQTGLLKGAAGYAQSRWHAGQDDAVAHGSDVLGAASHLPECLWIVEALGLGPILERRVTELSNGERRKLMLAKAAARRPAVLVLDNPFNGLDQPSRAIFSDAVRRLHGEGMTVVLTMSRDDELPRAVTHVLLLDDGRVIVSGARDSVLADGRYAEVMGSGPRRVADESRPKMPGSLNTTTREASADGPPEGRARESCASADHTPVVELRDVDLRYGSAHILRAVSWTVHRGERWVVVGPNGAGKSALLSLILTDNPQAYANDVSLFGRRRGSGDTIWEIRRRIGCVSPEMHLYARPDHRVRDVLAAGLRNPLEPSRRLTPEELQTAESSLASLGMQGCSDRRFGEMSEGERQMVLVVRALARRPELLVLDEPCQGLDPGRRDRFLKILEETLRTTDTTLIYVTHDPDEIPSAMTHGLLLRSGTAALEGSVTETLEAYLDG